MGKHGLLLILVGVALGANFVLGAWLVTNSLSPTVAHGGTVDTGGGYTLATGRLQGRGDADALYIWHHDTKKLGIYLVNGKTLEVVAIRDCSYDFAVPGFSAKGGRQLPEAKDMKRASGNK